jgi:hypothetical protein
VARHLERAEIEAAWSAARELGYTCYVILRSNESGYCPEDAGLADSPAMRIGQLWSNYVDRATAIQKACATFSHFDSRGDEIGMPGNCMHQAISRFAGRIKQETWNVTIYAMLRSGAEGLPNSSHIVEHWEAVRKALEGLGRFDWPAIESKLEREAASAFDALAKRKQLDCNSDRSSERFQDRYGARRAAFAQKWLQAGLSWTEIAAKYRRDAKYEDDCEFDVNKLQSAWRFKFDVPAKTSARRFR